MHPPPTEAFITLLTNNNYASGALVLGHSLRVHQTTKRLAILITSAVSESVRTHLAKVYDDLIEIHEIDSHSIQNLALLGRPELGVTLTKIHVFNQTQYSKVVFLDADTLVLRNVDDLFDRANGEVPLPVAPASTSATTSSTPAGTEAAKPAVDKEEEAKQRASRFAAAPDAGWPDCFNSGVFVCRPSYQDYQGLIEMASTEGTFDGGDQGLLNSYFSGWSRGPTENRLPFVYNTTPSSVYSYAPAFQQYRQDLAIIHFVGSFKPWQWLRFADGQVFPRNTSSKDSIALVQRWWDIFDKRVGGKPSDIHDVHHGYTLPTSQWDSVGLDGRPTAPVTEKQPHYEGWFKAYPPPPPPSGHHQHHVHHHHQHNDHHQHHHHHQQEHHHHEHHQHEHHGHEHHGHQHGEHHHHENKEHEHHHHEHHGHHSDHHQENKEHVHHHHEHHGEHHGEHHHHKHHEHHQKHEELPWQPPMPPRHSDRLHWHEDHSKKEEHHHHHHHQEHHEHHHHHSEKHSEPTSPFNPHHMTDYHYHALPPPPKVPEIPEHHGHDHHHHHHNKEHHHHKHEEHHHHHHEEDNNPHHLTDYRYRLPPSLETSIESHIKDIVPEPVGLPDMYYPNVWDLPQDPSTKHPHLPVTPLVIEYRQVTAPTELDTTSAPSGKGQAVFPWESQQNGRKSGSQTPSRKYYNFAASAEERQRQREIEIARRLALEEAALETIRKQERERFERDRAKEEADERQYGNHAFENFRLINAWDIDVGVQMSILEKTERRKVPHPRSRRNSMVGLRRGHGLEDMYAYEARARQEAYEQELIQKRLEEEHRWQIEQEEARVKEEEARLETLRRQNLQHQQQQRSKMRRELQMSQEISARAATAGESASRGFASGARDDSALPSPAAEAYVFQNAWDPPNMALKKKKLRIEDDEIDVALPLRKNRNSMMAGESSEYSFENSGRWGHQQQQQHKHTTARTVTSRSSAAADGGLTNFGGSSTKISTGAQREYTMGHVAHGATAGAAESDSVAIARSGSATAATSASSIEAATLSKEAFESLQRELGQTRSRTTTNEGTVATETSTSPAGTRFVRTTITTTVTRKKFVGGVQTDSTFETNTRAGEKRFEVPATTYTRTIRSNTEHSTLGSESTEKETSSSGLLIKGSSVSAKESPSSSSAAFASSSSTSAATAAAGSGAGMILSSTAVEDEDLSVDASGHGVKKTTTTTTTTTTAKDLHGDQSSSSFSESAATESSSHYTKQFGGEYRQQLSGGSRGFAEHRSISSSNKEGVSLSAAAAVQDADATTATTTTTVRRFSLEDEEGSAAAVAEAMEVLNKYPQATVTRHRHQSKHSAASRIDDNSTLYAVDPNLPKTTKTEVTTGKSKERANRPANIRVKMDEETGEIVRDSDENGDAYEEEMEDDEALEYFGERVTRASLPMASPYMPSTPLTGTSKGFYGGYASGYSSRASSRPGTPGLSSSSRFSGTSIQQFKKTADAAASASSRSHSRSSSWGGGRLGQLSMTQVHGASRPQAQEQKPVDEGFSNYKIEWNWKELLGKKPRHWSAQEGEEHYDPYNALSTHGSLIGSDDEDDDARSMLELNSSDEEEDEEAAAAMHQRGSSSSGGPSRGPASISPSSSPRPGLSRSSSSGLESVGGVFAQGEDDELARETGFVIRGGKIARRRSSMALDRREL